MATRLRRDAKGGREPDRAAGRQAVGATAAQAITEIFGTPVKQNERGWLAEIRDD